VIRSRGLAVLLLGLLLAAPACAPTEREASSGPAPVDTLLMTADGVGRVKIGMTLEEARFERTSDGEGIALVTMTLGGSERLTLYADERDARAPIAFERRVEFIEVSDSVFHTADGTRPGALVADVAAKYGHVRMILRSEIEQREFLECEGQPDWLTLRLGPGAIYPEGDRATTLFAPETRILSMSVAHFQEQP
jgi:hypothetical protein